MGGKRCQEKCQQPLIHDREAGITERVSVRDDGLAGVMTSTHASISADGRLVAFASLVETLVEGDDNLLQDIFVRDRVSGTTVRVNVASDSAQANGTSDFPAISADGRAVAFQSGAGNLVNNDTNNEPDVFVYAR